MQFFNFKLVEPKMYDNWRAYFTYRY